MFTINVRDITISPTRRHASSAPQNITPENCNVFFNDPTMQQTLLEGFLDGKISDQHVSNALKETLPYSALTPNVQDVINVLQKCTPCISEENQIKFMESPRAAALTHLLSAQPEMAFILQFFADVPAGSFPAKLVEIRAAHQHQTQIANELLTLLRDNAFSKSHSWEKEAKLFRELTNIPSTVLRFDTNNVLECVPLSIPPKVQIQIAETIGLIRFGEDTTFLQAVADKLDMFTDGEAQIQIASAIANGKFSTDTALLQTLAKKLALFTECEAQQLIKHAINQGIFSKDPIARKAVAETPAYYDTILRRRLYEKKGLPLKQPDSLNENTATASQEAKFASKNAVMLNLRNFIVAPGTKIIELLKMHFPSVIDPVWEFLCNDDEHYALMLNGAQASLYLLPANYANHIGFQTQITFDQAKLVIFDFSMLNEGFPNMIRGTDLSPVHNIIPTLPSDLRQAIFDNQPNLTNPAAFIHAPIIEFITETLLKPLMKADPNLAIKMKYIMQSSIANGGETIHISENNAQDTNIKHDINMLCENVANNVDVDFSSIVNQYFDQLTDNDKARLAVLLANMNKHGVLGYYKDGNNYSNYLLRSLAKECFDQLKESTSIIFPPNFHEDLANGICVVELANEFVRMNAAINWQNFNDVFTKVA